MNDHPILNVAQDVAVAAGDVLLKYFGSADIQEKNSTQNLVTQADLESEALITKRIMEAFPSHVFMGEETEFTGDLQSEHLWVVDPLDATTNYAHGIPHFCVSVAYAKRGEVQVGVVYDPIREEIFRAVKGQGAELNGKPIRVSQPSGLNRSVIGTGFYYDRGKTMQQTLKAIETLFQRNIRGLRRMGAAALDLTWVACGRFEGFFEYQLAPWDYAAGSLIVEEAGGRCTDRYGKALTLESKSMIAACNVIADELTELVRYRESTAG